jgi:hypothetical protein
LPFGHQRGPEEQPSEFRALAGLRKYIQLLFAAVILTGETQQLKEESTAPTIRRLITDFSSKRLYRLAQLTRADEFVWTHGGLTITYDLASVFLIWLH